MTRFGLSGHDVTSSSILAVSDLGFWKGGFLRPIDILL